MTPTPSLLGVLASKGGRVHAWHVPHVRSPEDFAAVLGVPAAAIPLVIQEDKFCQAKISRKLDLIREF